MAAMALDMLEELLRFHPTRFMDDRQGSRPPPRRTSGLMPITKAPIIRWRAHLRSAPAVVFRMLATAEGRARFWAESAEEADGIICFRFSNGQQLDAEVWQSVSPSRLQLTYFGGSVVTFELQEAEGGGTDLTLTEECAPPEEYEQNRAGWVSVLLMLKAAVDYQVDLRNEDPGRTWEQGYIDV
jgi:uncharacterized protein YndB with AHSA1/START domain